MSSRFLTIFFRKEWLCCCLWPRSGGNVRSLEPTGPYAYQVREGGCHTSHAYTCCIASIVGWGHWILTGMAHKRIGSCSRRIKVHRHHSHETQRTSEPSRSRMHERSRRNP
ncbi:hypothetical protein CIHG_08259 [Coccidioides immitis H538.4]|uniref:Uncharacterized protein n=3 Tax=Coccidioides immitis TaxID=5501 RepID=A0A0J8QR39_COCIT|nr:hypothetical protein CIRG_02327 [Coccidioides immitis RMSCC 2394]KMU74560.1 hypothetical protein CISG_04267 [Coccidioides immitis RMSCC 3703]KMU90544.1 hypothetical protein CIHG_08259 [Coccidioides immitis H538.4]